MVKVNSLVDSLPATIPFVGPEKLERENGQPFRARLGANECNFGTSPFAVEAIDRAARADVWKYSDADSFELRQALAAHYGIGENEILVGAGIDSLLGLCVRIFSREGGPIVTSLGAYPTFNYHVNGYGRRLITVPYREDREDLDALAEAALNEQADIVYVSNPDNPMGTWWEASDVIEFAGKLPDDTLLLLDEAYCELAPEGAVPDFGELPDNVIRLRTFSKVYGLAGLRAGYAIGSPSLIAQFDKVRDHFGVNVIAQQAALAALSDQPFLSTVIRQFEASRKRIAGIARSNGLVPIRSATNFVTMDCRRDGAYAKRVLEELNARAVFIRKPGAPGLDRCIRISCGLPHELDYLEAALPEALQAAES